MNRLILASASARRTKILRELGVSFDVIAPDVDEVVIADDPRQTAIENARRKSRWCVERHPARHSIAADTVIEFRGRCIGKAETAQEALSFLRAFSGNTHVVYTAVAMSRPNSQPEIAVAESSVRFRKLTEREILDYFNSVNPMDRAGAYDIDEEGEMLIESFFGSRTNIMGLPVEIAAEWLKREGFL